MNKTILVTGVAGFIGSNTAEYLLKRGDAVIGIDNYDTYYSPSRKDSNLKEVQDNIGEISNLTVIRGDIRQQGLLVDIFRTNKIDAIVHLAALAGVRASIDSPHIYYDVNLGGTLNLLDAAKNNGIGNFVFASTSSVYGDTDIIPFVETDKCDRPLAPYPASKRAAEMLGFAYHHLHRLNFTALRFFTVYGPRGRPDMMAYKVLESIYDGTEVPLFNAGQMYRDWTYVDDIVAGIVAAVDRPLGYDVINLGRGEPVLLATFVERLEQLAGKKATLVSRPMPDADISYTFADISKGRRLLGYDPKVSVTEGTERFFQWFNRRILNNSA